LRTFSGTRLRTVLGWGFVFVIASVDLWRGASWGRFCARTFRFLRHSTFAGTRRRLSQRTDDPHSMPILPRTVRFFVQMPKLATRAILASATAVVGVAVAPAAADAGPGPTPTISTTSSTAPLGPAANNITTSTTQISSTTTTTAPVPVTLKPAQVQQMSALQREITHTGTLLDQLAETYDADTTQLGTLQQDEASTRAGVATAQRKLAATRMHLRADALIAYMGSVPLNDITTTLSFSNSNAAAVTSEYQQVAIANTSSVASAYEADVQALAADDATLRTTESQIRTDLAQINDARLAAMAAASTQQASLAALSAGSEPPDPTYLAAQSAGRNAVVADRSTLPLPQALAAAIWAAASQVGVPYVWGGETPLPGPDAGFDCSGLVQWAYGQAGITLPRTAQEQHDAVTPIPADQAQPGDLVFWDDGTTSVQHVAIYVGAGIVLEAPSTGSVISYSALWTNGLVGFGRPNVPAP
jgi:cell wall-associated NlpC family hydrolase